MKKFFSNADILLCAKCCRTSVVCYLRHRVKSAYYLDGGIVESGCFTKKE